MNEQTTTNGLYGLKGPEELFMKLQNDMGEFHKNPHEWNLFNLLCTLNHLRDWICPGGWNSYKNIPEEALSRAQRFHRHLHNDNDYIVVRDLCNNAKHFYGVGNGSRTYSVDGAHVGLMRAGDRLDQRYFLVGGVDLRNHIFDLMSKYYRYFSVCAEGDVVD